MHSPITDPVAQGSCRASPGALFHPSSPPSPEEGPGGSLVAAPPSGAFPPVTAWPDDSSSLAEEIGKLVFEKPQKCFFYRNSSCYLLYTTPAMGRILNILPAPLMEMWFGVIWVLIWINPIYAAPVAPGRHQARTLQVILFLCSCHVPVLEL